MKQSVMLTITSLLTLLFISFHHADDIVRGFAPGNFSDLIPIVFMVIWLFGSKLVLDERRSGYILILILSFLASGLPVIHMRGAGIAGGRIATPCSLFLRLDTHHDRRDLALLRPTSSARAVEPATQSTQTGWRLAQDQNNSASWIEPVPLAERAGMK